MGGSRRAYEHRLIQSHSHNGGMAVHPVGLGNDAGALLHQGEQTVAGLGNHQDVPGTETLQRVLLIGGDTQVADGVQLIDAGALH